MDDIARRAGVAKGTIYYHFDSKDQLLQRALEAELKRIHTALTAPGAAPEEQLRRTLHSLAYWITGQPERLRALLTAWQPGSGLRASTVRRLRQQLVRTLSEVLVASQAAKLIDPSWPTELLSVALYGALGHVVEHVRHQGESLDPKGLAEALLAFLLRKPL